MSFDAKNDDNLLFHKRGGGYMLYPLKRDTKIGLGSPVSAVPAFVLLGIATAGSPLQGGFAFGVPWSSDDRYQFFRRKNIIL